MRIKQSSLTFGRTRASSSFSSRLSSSLEGVGDEDFVEGAGGGKKGIDVGQPQAMAELMGNVTKSAQRIVLQ